MSKKVILILVVLAVALLAGGYFIFSQIRAAQERAAYEVSSDKVADDVTAAIAAKDITKAMNYFSSDLKANYSEAYWKDTILAELQGYSGTPTRHAKGPVQSANNAPRPYDTQLQQDATQYEYDFRGVNNATYRLVLVVFRQNNAWKVNELSGGYLP